MDSKAAITKAKEYVAEVFEGEEIKDLGLEEIKFDYGRKIWSVTLGFSRPWDQSRFVSTLAENKAPRRSYKVVTIQNDDGMITGLRNWTKLDE